MTRYPNKKNNNLIVHGKDEADNEIISFFKEVCVRDGLEMRKELLELLRHTWAVKHHYPLGHSQYQIAEFFEERVHEESVAVCEVCGEPAVYKVKTKFPINPDKLLCRSHTSQYERGSEVIKKVKL